MQERFKRYSPWLPSESQAGSSRERSTRTPMMVSALRVVLGAYAVNLGAALRSGSRVFVLGPGFTSSPGVSRHETRERERERAPLTLSRASTSRAHHSASRAASWRLCAKTRETTLALATESTSRGALNSASRAASWRLYARGRKMSPPPKQAPWR